MKVYEFGAEHEKCFVFFQCAAEAVRYAEAVGKEVVRIGSV